MNSNTFNQSKYFSSKGSFNPRQSFHKKSLTATQNDNDQKSRSLKKLLKETNVLKSHHLKQWFQKKVPQSYLSDPNKEIKVSSLSKPRPVTMQKYLMSEDEIKQTQMIESIFKKFDKDGTGSLDTNELQDLFKEVNLYFDRETIRKLFGGNSFTLQKFKEILKSQEQLKRIRDILNS